MSTASPFTPIEFKGPSEDDANVNDPQQSYTDRTPKDKVLMLKKKHSGIVRQKQAEKSRDKRTTSNKKSSKFVLAEHGYVPGVEKGKDEGARRKFAGPHRIYTEMDDEDKKKQKESDEIVAADEEEQQEEEDQFKEHQDQADPQSTKGLDIETSTSKSSRISGRLETIYSIKESEGGSGQVGGQSGQIWIDKSSNLHSQALDTVNSERLQRPGLSKSSQFPHDNARSSKVVEIQPQVQKRESGGYNDRLQLRGQPTSSSAVYESDEKYRYYRSMDGSIIPPTDATVVHQQIAHPLARRVTYSFRVAQRLPCLCGRRFRLID